jgi:hypothetical protein
MRFGVGLRGDVGTVDAGQFGFPNEWEALLRRVIGLRQAKLKIAELGCCPSNAQATFVRQFECSIAEPHFPAQEIATL